MKTAAARFNALLTARTTVLDKARAASRLTIPGLVPESGQNEHFTPTQPYQSVGAHGVRSLSSRLFMTLFPTNVPFFRLTLDASVAEGLMTDPNFDKNAADATMAQYAQSASSILEDRLMRPVIAEALKHLVIAGNVLLWIPTKGAPRIYRLDQYVLKRNSVGQPISIVVQEKVYPSTLSAEVRALCNVTWEPGKAEDPIDIFTVVEKEGEQHKHWQEINNVRVPGSEGSAPIEQSGWLALRWLAVPGSDYGRSHVTEYGADLMSLEDANEAMLKFATVAARVTFLVDPNSSLQTSELAASQSGDYLYGKSTDVSTLQLDKSQDFSVIRTVSVDPMDPRQDLTPRQHPTNGMCLWDAANLSWSISAPVICRIRWSFTFDALPELARGYAVIAAGRKFQARFVGAPELDRFAAEDQQRAWLALQREQAATADINVFRASDEIARKVNRGRMASPRRFAK